MKNLINLIRHGVAYLLMRSLEIELHNKIKASDRCQNDDERIDNAVSRRILQRELVHARMRLAEFSKPGERKTWDIA